ncbi:MAG: archaetidylserine decarboxylase [Porticoccaceae bacterium]|nr:archaetidylserine decarboxylase [Porticoccaceae bacterium]
MNHSAEIFVALQRLLPKHAVSRLIAKLAESKCRRLKNLLINRAIKTFDINMQEALSDDLDHYENFNAFFTRQLKPDARPLDSEDNSAVSPADGAISQAGKITDHRIIQAKGVDYSLNRLIGDSNQGKLYNHGTFATIYLSPKDYHRVHIPVDGQLLSTRYIPGELFSVNKQTTEALPGLFARNERLVCEFKSQQIGHFSVIFVGAMLVAGIETVWGGFEPPGPGAVRETDYSTENLMFSKGAEIGRFKFGSTVIMLFQDRAITLDNYIKPSAIVKMGDKIGMLSTTN